MEFWLLSELSNSSPFLLLISEYEEEQILGLLLMLYSWEEHRNVRIRLGLQYLVYLLLLVSYAHDVWTFVLVDFWKFLEIELLKLVLDFIWCNYSLRIVTALKKALHEYNVKTLWVCGHYHMPELSIGLGVWHSLCYFRLCCTRKR